MRDMTSHMTLSLSNPKHQVFADAYIVSGNATQSAIKAGYKAESAGVTGHKMLKMPAIAEYIAASRMVNREAANFDSQRLIKEFSLLAHSNVQDYTRVNDDGDLEVDFSAASRDQLAAVSGVKVRKRKIYDNKGNVVGEEHNTEFKLWDKIRAGELLGKHHGMFKEADTRVVVDVADRLLSARQRVLSGAVIEHNSSGEED